MRKIGALTSKVSAFKGRPWELKYVPSLDQCDSLGSNLLLNVKGRKVLRAVPSYNQNLQIEWVSDRSRYFHETNSKQRLSWAALKTKTTYKKVVNYAQVNAQIKGWIANQPTLDLCVGSNLDLGILASLKVYGRSLGADLNSEIVSACAKTFNSDYLSTKTLKELEHVEICTFIGVNPRLETPIGNLLFRLRYLIGNFKTEVVGNSAELYTHPKNYGSLSNKVQNFAFGKHTSNLEVLKSKSRLVVYGDSCSNRQDCVSWLNLQSPVHLAKFSSVIRLSTYSNLIGLDYFNFGENDQENSTYFVAPNNKSSFLRIKNKNLLVSSSHLYSFINGADFLYPLPSYLEKDTSFLSYDGKINTSYKALNPFANSLSSVKDILALSTTIKAGGKSFFSKWKKTSSLKYLKSCTSYLDGNKCKKLKTDQLKIIKSPIKTYLGNAYTPVALTKLSPTLMQCGKHIQTQYFSFL